jgi:hypothetical protein
MHVHHIVICDMSGSSTFSPIISQMAQLKKKLLNVKCVFWFSLQLFSEAFLILNWDRYDKKYTLVFT